MTRRTSWRWTVPVLSAGVVAAVVAAPHAVAASAHPSLPARSAADLIAAVEGSDVQALSGTVHTSANLGLPQLPDSLAGAGAGWLTLLTGARQLRIWVDGRDRQRVALLGDLSETDVVHDGRQLWTWSSATRTVSHQTLSASSRSTADHASPDAAEQLTPQAQAEKALSAINPTTAVTVDRTARVAGRAAYQVVLTPRTSSTLIRSVRIAVDATRSVPLRVQIYATGSTKPAFETGFTTISFHRPAASLFQFSPPAGSHLTKTPLADTERTAGQQPDSAQSKPMTIGSGWAAVLELPAGTVDLSAPPVTTGRDQGAGRLAGALREVTTAVPQGRLLTTRLLSVLITPDGRVLVGAVPAATVERAAGA